MVVGAKRGGGAVPWEVQAATIMARVNATPWMRAPIARLVCIGVTLVSHSCVENGATLSVEAARLCVGASAGRGIEGMTEK